MEPQIQYCTAADGTRIAFSVRGDGDGVPFVYPGPVPFSNVREPMVSSGDNDPFFLGPPGSRPTCVLDYRGCGLSDRNVKDLSLEAVCSDLEAVVDRLGWQSFSLYGMGMSGPVAVLYTSTHPDRVTRLILRDTYLRASDMGRIPRMRALGAVLRVDWQSYCDLMALTMSGWEDAELAKSFSVWLTQNSTHEEVQAYAAATASYDVTDFAAEIKAPTLVINPNFIAVPSSDMARAMVARIPDSRLLLYGPKEIVDVFTRMEAFLAEGDAPRAAPTPSEFIELPSGTAIILFADIADSTGLTERLGDDAFREKARELDGALRAIIREYAGTPIEGKLLGDGVLAVFTSARQAIEAALGCAIAGGDAGLPLHLGLHAGDVIREENNVYGGAVNIASRISGLSAAGEVLVSETVRSLARTSAEVRFEDRGEQPLKGVGEPVRVWAVRDEEARKGDTNGTR
jgi:class 3 adenylate cyclase/pimeloyl-ACP methyl ester carboxylesterase